MPITLHGNRRSPLELAPLLGNGQEGMVPFPPKLAVTKTKAAAAAPAPASAAGKSTAMPWKGVEKKSKLQPPPPPAPDGTGRAGGPPPPPPVKGGRVSKGEASATGKKSWIRVDESKLTPEQVLRLEARRERERERQRLKKRRRKEKLLALSAAQAAGLPPPF